MYFKDKIRKQSKSSSKSTSAISVCGIRVKHISFILIFNNFLAMIISPAVELPAYFKYHYLNTQICHFMFLFIFAFGAMSKCLVHLFVVLRSRLTYSDNKTPYYKIGIFI